MNFRHLLLVSLGFAVLVAGCKQLPTSGPSSAQMSSAPDVLQLVDVDDGVARRLASQRKQVPFSESLSASQTSTAGYSIGRGDILEVTIWEAPPATLFGGGGASDTKAPSTSRAFTLPEQMVDRDGSITVPFAGQIVAAGLTSRAIEADIVKRLKGKANQPEVLVRVTRNSSATVTVVGEVNTSMRMPLTAGEEHVLDALAAAGGVRQPVSKTTIQITRGGQFHSMPLDSIIRDPKQNVALNPGDVITALHQPLSFTALGATGKNEEIAFEAQGITLAQALARSGGLNDARSDAKGVFIFRFEDKHAIEWPKHPVVVTADGLVPAVYRVDLSNPASFLMLQSFQMKNKDVLYVSNAPSVEIQKFLTLVFSLAYPVLNTIQVTR